MEIVKATRSAVDLLKIDSFLRKLDTAQDDDQLRLFFSEYSAEYDTQVSSDPFGQEYRDKQFSLYKQLAGKSYDSANEKTNFDVEVAATSPFPYCHGSSQTVGDQLMAIGFLIKSMGLPKNSSILEFGPGWGNTTIALAKMGYKVTAVDIEQNFVSLITRRAEMENVSVNVAQGDFSKLNSIGSTFDAILFFECFHHSADHLALIEGFERVVKPGGLVCFGAEPIDDDFPIPWGLRMDGESLWAIRKNGWLELGFNSKYFSEALGRSGWVASAQAGSDGPWSKVLIAKRSIDWITTYRFSKNELRSQAGVFNLEGIEARGAEEGWLMFGPYINLARGRWRATVLIDPEFVRSGFIIVDATSSAGQHLLHEPKKFALEPFAEGRPVISFVCETQMAGVEIRVWCPSGTLVRITGVEIQFLGSS